jgi:hypothetical protein
MTSDNNRSITELLAALCDETISPEEMQRLDHLICSDAAVRRQYIEYLDLHARLSYQFHRLDESILSGEPFAQGDQVLPLDAAPAAVLFPSIVVQHPPGLPASISPLVSRYASFAVSYSLAAVIVGIGLLVGWACQVSTSDRLARNQARPTAPPRHPDRLMVFVGRVTGMVECRWADRKTETVPYAHVPLGRKYALASGLMEITYDNGARVILEGPCTYQVESQTGGFLSIGRLTARVGAARGDRSTEGGRSNQVSESPNLQITKSPNSSVPSPLFAIRTPTALVTDFGTEFGVRVAEDGTTESHVFQGKVMLTALDAGKRPVEKILLAANESARVDKKDGGKSAAVRRQKVSADGFVRSEQFAQRAKELGEAPLRPFRRWQAESETLRTRDGLLAYYDFQRDPDHPRDQGGYELLRNRASSGSKYDGCVRGSIRMGMTQGRFPGKDALRFAYPGDGVRVNIPVELPRLTLAAWIALERNDLLAGILMSDNFDRAGCVHWQFVAGSAYKVGSAAANFDFVVQTPVVKDFTRWHLWCWVHDAPARRAIAYVDGRRLAEWPLANPLNLKIGEATIGNWDGLYYDSARPLGGRMDELAIFSRALGDAEIKALYESGGENAVYKTSRRGDERGLTGLKAEDNPR